MGCSPSESEFDKSVGAKAQVTVYRPEPGFKQCLDVIESPSVWMSQDH
jgi:hypothetical protein